ncbi:amino acid/amide ABC transporter substrate-binding protein, HAAT family [Nocardioides sp. YR527]|uniref:amino acid ABC transporter substrate-binding protein n=1 Tax=Nocardioides sp. YR527 TaxID=1881028 RepID=UPI0008905B40|nr:amino acid ABC transporter substrate-binding protein [Nocardioides sp. YR527]SDK57096.1 amino acid/amide ABC transporter substrate-binding protein, HAAT family [Nocardioides sp. YR527]
MKRNIRSPFRGTRGGAAVAVVSLLVLSAGCGLSGSDPSDGDGPIVIGMSLPLSGPVADRAKPGMEGYQYWVDELNSNGGLLGREVELKVLDDGFDQQTAISDYTRLISEDKVDLVLGTFSSDLNVAVAPVAERFGYAYVQPSGGADEIFERDLEYLFFAQPATTQKLPDRFVELLSTMPEAERPETVGLVQLDDPNTTQAAKLFSDQLAELGIETVYDVTYSPDTSNFDAIASDIKQSDPDLVINGAIAVDGMSLIRSMQKVGFSPPMLYQMNAPTDPTYAETIGEANTEGIFTYLAWSPEAAYPTNDGFVSGYTEEYGAAPSEDAANSYTAGQVLAEAVDSVGSLDQEAIKDWLHANSVETIVGPLNWDETGRPQGDMLLGQFQDGEIKIVGPDSAATTDEVIYAKPEWQ